METRELSKNEIIKLVEQCKHAESLRCQLNNEDIHNEGVKQAVKILNKTRDISYNGIRIESAYDRTSRNWFNVWYEWYNPINHSNNPLFNPFWGSVQYDYSGHIDSCATGHIWLIIEKFGNVK